jgi:two-component system, NtrC family, nitrogen regulation sensor histidine kinase NtrY
MVLKRHSLLLLLRLVLLLGNFMLIAYLWGDERLIFNQVIAWTVAVAQAWDLWRFTTRTNKALARLLDAVRHADFAVNFPDTLKGSGFEDLHASLQEMARVYGQVKIERESQFQFLQQVVSRLPIGVVVLDTQGHIPLSNTAASSILHVEGLRNLRHLQSIAPKLTQHLEEREGAGPQLLEEMGPHESQTLLAEVYAFDLLEKPYRLITLQDVQSELDRKEVEAWHKLIRILTHEIMNSVTPIASLSETLDTLLSRQNPEVPLPTATLDDLRLSVRTIGKRSEGLLQFMEDYRAVSRLQRPKFQPLEVEKWLQGVVKLAFPSGIPSGIQVDVHVTPLALTLRADPAMMEQIYLNLIKNSLHALENRPHPTLRLGARRENQKVVLTVEDNGCGMDDKIKTEAFIPFFSTKKEGSGIGLSLSKQMVLQQGGQIILTSQPGKGTQVVMRFPTVAPLL